MLQVSTTAELGDFDSVFNHRLATRCLRCYRLGHLLQVVRRQSPAQVQNSVAAIAIDHLDGAITAIAQRPFYSIFQRLEFVSVVNHPSTSAMQKQKGKDARHDSQKSDRDKRQQP